MSRAAGLPIDGEPIWCDGMKIIDPHIHLWDIRQVSYPWLAKPRIAYSGDNRLLPQRHHVAAFLGKVGDIEVEASVNVEANPADPVAEAAWLQAMADNPASHGHPHGIVANADLSSAATPRLFEQLAGYRNLRGIRQILNVHPNPCYNYVGSQYMEQREWRQNLALLADYGWSFDLQIYPAQVPSAVEVIRAHPGIRFILNHAGMFVDRDRPAGWRQWREGLRALAACENTAVKVSGLAMFDHHWTVESFRPYVLEVIDSFGVERSMFASNFPIDGLHTTYPKLWHSYAKIVEGASAAEREQLFVSNARRLYRL